MAIRTVLVEADRLLALRQEVLRPGQPLEAVRFPEDELPGTFHVAAYEPGPGAGDSAGAEMSVPDTPVLACGSFAPEDFPAGLTPPPTRAGHAPGRAAGRAYRIRGMASDPAVRGGGYGTAVLRAGTAEAASRGVELLWCNGRKVARGFYERHGYTVVGGEFHIEGVGPHYVFARALD